MWVKRTLKIKLLPGKEQANSLPQTLRACNLISDIDPGDLKGKSFRSRAGEWCFNQLRRYILHRAALAGIPVVLQGPRYTSKTDPVCYPAGNRTGKAFQCTNCGYGIDAAPHARRHIAPLGAGVNAPERCGMYSCAVHY